MKKTILVFLFISAFSSPCFSQLVRDMQKVNDQKLSVFNANGNEVWFFEDANFQGKKKVLSPGRYTLAQLGTTWNDVISSVKVPNGYQVVLYQHDNFQGEGLSFMNTLLNGVYYGGVYPNLATLQEDAYTTVAIRKPEAWRKQADGTFIVTFNDTASSIVIAKI